MIRKIFLFTFMFFLIFTNHSFAHTGLKDSSPKNQEIVTEELKTITLTFETKIELSSTFELGNSNGEPIPIDDISLNENQMVGNLSSPLDNGSYQVNWKIIGADGHPIEGKFSFQVDVPTAEPPAEEPKEPEQATENETTKESNSEGINEQNELPSYVIPAAIGLLIALFVGSFLWIMRRGK
ncbi:copper resistance CopC family protein [Bacillus sp. V59.32b]|uniref:copper resistance CopC family protein n=1 Tax=Bacillus sp. V59.32b TaxID=1758642 RepID=UPI000E3C8D07|nr:copper resistance CopC family protein [Bacillus sp. V59.32b]RFU66121.1 copper resistance protein CopC [Bacillus sp. V59.32b]